MFLTFITALIMWYSNSSIDDFNNIVKLISRVQQIPVCLVLALILLQKVAFRLDFTTSLIFLEPLFLVT